MKPKLLTQLHCGACGTEFDNIYELTVHIETCLAAEVILPFFHMAAFNDLIGHPFSGWVHLLHRSQSLIKRYAHAVAGNFDNLTRAKIHIELCDSLEIKYNDFKPFESSTITSVPSLEEAQRLIWAELCSYILHLIYKPESSLRK